MALYYFLPKFIGIFLGTLLTVVITKITDTPNATLRNAFYLSAGTSVTWHLVDVLFTESLAVYALLFIAQYVLILKIFRIPHHFVLLFVFLNTVFGLAITMLISGIVVELALPFI